MDNNALVSVYDFLKTFFTIVDIFLFAFFVFLIAKSWRFRPKLNAKVGGEKTYMLGNAIIKERWDSVIRRCMINSSESTKLAILDADNLVNELLERMGLEGEHMADRLENLTTEDFATLERLWASHRVRNKLVHEHGFTVSQEEALRVVDDYGSFLREIGAIEAK